MYVPVLVPKHVLKFGPHVFKHDSRSKIHVLRIKIILFYFSRQDLCFRHVNSFFYQDSCFKNQDNSILFFSARSCLRIVFFFSLLRAIVIHNSLYMITTYFLRSEGRLASCQSEERGTRIRVGILADPRRIPPGE